MNHEPIHLKRYFSQLDPETDPTLTFYADDGILAETRPVILILPGGGYSMISGREGAPIAKRFARAGFITTVLSYSVAPKRFPVQMSEVAAALEFIHLKAEEWKLDSNRIAILGFSAGGHLAAHYTNAYDSEKVRSIFPDSKPVHATILCYPVITAIPPYADQHTFEELLGKNLTDEERRAFSCEKMVSPKTPATFIWHTAQDKVVPVENSILYASACSKNRVPFELHIYPYGPHGLATVDRETNENLSKKEELAADWIPACVSWLGNCLSD